MASVGINAVRKTYGAVPVLHGVDVEIEDGEFIILVGPSGCGKSTLLRMVAGLESISGGTIEIDGRVVNDVAAKERDIAMVFQTYALYPHMTVGENMGFSLKLAGRPKADIEAKVRAAAEILALTPLLDRHPRQLSGGQRQRVAMGRAIVRDPKVFLFDEPLSNLDAKLRVQMRSEIKDLHRRLGSTILYVTHDQIEAMTMADRIVVMQGGHVQQIGKPLDIYDRPINTFVATVIGSPAMNLVTGVVERSDRGLQLRCEDGSIILLPGERAHLFAGRKVTVGFRPEHVRLARPGEIASLTADMAVVEPTGAETFVSMRFAGQELIAVLRERTDAAPGEKLALALDGERLHFFGEDGMRLSD